MAVSSDTSLAREIEDRVREYIEKQRTVRPARTNWASSLWHPCIRYLTWKRTRWMEQEPVDAGLVEIFIEGNAQEATAIRLLQNAGVPFLEQQVWLEWPEYQISGRIDGVVEWNGKRVPADIKSASDWTFRKINGVEDLLKADGYLRGYLIQIGLYMFMKEVSVGLLIFKNKNAAKIKVIEVDLDTVIPLVEEALKKAEIVNKNVQAGTDPDGVWSKECARCPFRKICDVSPPEAEVPEDLLELEGLLHRRAELKPILDEYKRIEERIKTAFKSRGPGEYHVGPYRIRVKEYQTTRYKIPDELKAQFAVTATAVRVEIQEL